MKQIVMELTFVRSTPGTHVYASADPNCPTKQLYLSKSDPFFNGQVPEAITVTVVAK